MIEVQNKFDCCGCESCANICPLQCISMIYDEEGFLYPSVDNSICIKCKQCMKVCPIQNYKEEKENTSTIGAIVANKDELIRSQSTSGGAFTAIAEYIIKYGGVVFGVEINEKFTVQHIEVDNIVDLEKFRNSKYVQSEIRDTYKCVKNYLEVGRFVCFSGTPCQIEGLLKFLDKNYENLILVDVVCRAVPSPGVWFRYVNWLENMQGKITSIRFRDKAYGYQYSTMEIRYKNGFVSRNGIESDSWLRMFFSGMIIRPSCTKCRFRKMSRKSDFTIWDCFNFVDKDLNFDEKKGATKILIHTNKGLDIFSNIKDNFFYKTVPTDILIKGNQEMLKSPKENIKRSDFFYDYQYLEMGALIQKYFPNTSGIFIKKYGRRCLNKLGLDIFVKRLRRRMNERSSDF